MDIKAYIESGILELYVAGSLSEKENKEVYELMQQHPEILQEVLNIEAAIIKLTAAASNNKKTDSLQAIKNKLGFNNDDAKVISITKPKYNWITYTGWAASIILAVGLFYTSTENNQLKEEIQISETQQSLLETQIANSKNSLEEANTLISVLRDDNITKVPLAGQGNFASTYAKVYWDKNTQRIFLDAQGLPDPPEGKVYQVWSLKLSPLTPTSLGTIDNFTTDNNKIFEIINTNESEAFGITLEPAGGSKTPTMEQLYTLGVV
ncbi:anti-sigma factor domain-containing protein [Mariniflexile gromovii]|uniref:Anti-sigma factor n=1 Tax=Mariniflexile gromovii TaxID=362523 RepID=A0ABS4BRZ9_9FLAO|nr:anti-sigma factor [Mariniflexile gromovii]MBP0903361.1 anti-sigma factor [Mariniflexile gromovii]